MTVMFDDVRHPICFSPTPPITAAATSITATSITTTTTSTAPMTTIKNWLSTTINDFFKCNDLQEDQDSLAAASLHQYPPSPHHHHQHHRSSMVVAIFGRLSLPTSGLLRIRGDQELFSLRIWHWACPSDSGSVPHHSNAPPPSSEKSDVPEGGVEANGQLGGAEGNGQLGAAEGGAGGDERREGGPPRPRGSTAEHSGRICMVGICRNRAKWTCQYCMKFFCCTDCKCLLKTVCASCGCRAAIIAVDHDLLSEDAGSPAANSLTHAPGISGEVSSQYEGRMQLGGAKGGGGALCHSLSAIDLFSEDAGSPALYKSTYSLTHAHAPGKSPDSQSHHEPGKSPDSQMSADSSELSSQDEAEMQLGGAEGGEEALMDVCRRLSAIDAEMADKERTILLIKYWGNFGTGDPGEYRARINELKRHLELLKEEQRELIVTVANWAQK